VTAERSAAVRFPFLTLLVGAAVFLQSAGADAQSEPDEDEARYIWLSRELAQSERLDRTWWRAWTATYAVLAVGQGTFALASKDEGLRVDATVGAVKTTLGLVALLVSPQTPRWAVSSLREMDAGTPQARRLRRLRAEELLQAGASEESFGISWVPHVAAAVVNLAGAYILFHEYKRYVPGWVSLASGTAVAELQIVTLPTNAMGAQSRYAHAFQPAAGGRMASPRLAWSVAPALGGFVLSGSF
jgi:hypothetical protein